MLADDTTGVRTALRLVGLDGVARTTYYRRIRTDLGVTRLKATTAGQLDLVALVDELGGSPPCPGNDPSLEPPSGPGFAKRGTVVTPPTGIRPGRGSWWCATGGFGERARDGLASGRGGAGQSCKLLAD